MEGLTIRGATRADIGRIAEIIHGEPEPEILRICDDADRARAIGHALVQSGVQGWQYTNLAVLDGQGVGVLQVGLDESLPAILTVALRAVQVFGPVGAVQRLGWVRAQRRVNPKRPEGSYHISELHVHPQHRNRGLGGAALDYAEAEARKNNHRQMSLITTTVNPARRLYERHGFRVVETRTDPAYERYTGIPGRHLMVKELP